MKNYQFVNDGFINTEGIILNSNDFIKDGFTESNPFITEEESEEKIKKTKVKILLENIKNDKEIKNYNFNKRRFK